MSRKPRRFEIISPTEIMTVIEIRNIRITEKNLYKTIESSEVLNWFVKMRLLNNSKLCSVCNVSMHLVNSKSVVDLYIWKCATCKKTLSVRHGSYFFESRLKLATLAKLLYKLSFNLEIHNIGHDLEIHRNCVSKWAKIVRHSVVFYFEINKTKIGGVDEYGIPKIVEMDESLFFKRKYNRGVIREGQWYVGGVERGSSKAFILPVANRNQATIANIIVENVFQGTRIITDEWRAYRAAILTLEGYSHNTVNHSYNFVDPDDSEVHTQNVESLWSHAKKALRKKNGINKDSEFDHLIKFLWEKAVLKYKRFNEIIILFGALDYTILNE